MPNLSGLRAAIVDSRIFVLALLLGVFDGADLVGMGVTLVRISRLLRLDPSQAGLCASASLFGLVIGAAVCGRLADSYGRRAVLATATVFLGVFSLATPYAWSFQSLFTVRFLAGLGIGGVLPIVVAMAADAAAPDFRSRATGILMASGPVGGLIVGIIGLYDDWRWVFFFGGAGPLVLLPALYWINPARQLQAAGADTSRESTTAVLFGAGRTMGTLMIWAITFVTVLASYLLNNWLPALLVHQGMAEESSRVAALVFSVGCIVGNLGTGVLMDSAGPRFAYLGGYIGAGACAAALALLSGSPFTFAIIFATSVFLYGAQLVTIALTASFYPDTARTTGLGAMVAVGRLGSIVGPIAAGELLRGGFSADQIFLGLTPVFGLALVFALTFANLLDRHRSRSLAPQARLSDA